MGLQEGLIRYLLIPTMPRLAAVREREGSGMALPVAGGGRGDIAGVAGRRSEGLRQLPDDIAAMLADTLLDDDWTPEAALAPLCGSGAEDLAGRTAIVTRIARILGEWWVADTCSFADVTLGLHRLTLLLFALEALPDPGRARLHGGAVLLAPAAGDQHGFGLAVVAAALRHTGWDVSVELSGDEERLIRRAAAGRLDCIGLSVGHDRAIEPTRRLIERLRHATRATRPTIAVGGPMLTRHPNLAALVGADCSAEDGFALAAQLTGTGLAQAA